MLDLTFNQEQEMLREVVRSLCAQHCSLTTVRGLEDDPVGYSSDFWKQLAELDLLGLMLPEDYGGSGMSALEGVVLYEELGRAVAPSPHFVSSVLSAGVLMAAGSEEQKRQWLPQIVSGESILTPAWLEPDGGFGPAGVQLRAEQDGNDYVLSGVKRHVAFASSAERLLVLARTPDIELFLVGPGAEGVTLAQQHTIASDTQYQVHLDNVRVPAADRLGAGAGWQAWEAVRDDALILLAAWAVGAATYAQEITVQYAKDRHQFDKPIGSFQSIAHYLADHQTALDGARTLVHEAAWAKATGQSVARLAPMAKVFACRVFRDLTATAQQIFGGVGFTVDYDVQLYFRRAKSLQVGWWDDHYLEELIAADVLDV